MSVIHQRTIVTAFVSVALFVAVVKPVFTQGGAIRVRVLPNTISKSEPVRVAANEALLVRLVSADPGAAPVIGVYIYRADETLAAMHDSEKPSDAYTFQLAEGSYAV